MNTSKFSRQYFWRVSDVRFHTRLSKLQVQRMVYPVTRVRMTGEIGDADHIQVQHECTHGKDPMACKMIELGFRVVPVPEDEVS